MKLTNESFSVRVAAPHGVDCPTCKRSPGDWHSEWLPEGALERVRIGQAAMDCPYADCGAWVTGGKEGWKVLSPAGEGLTKVKRSLAQARKYEKGDTESGQLSQTGGLTIEQWIEQVVPAYKGYKFGP